MAEMNRDEWRTPNDLFNKLDHYVNFKFDYCASKINKKVQEYSSDFESLDVIPQPAWMNPPFSEAEYMFRHFFKVVKEGIAIYRVDNMETKVWQSIIIPKADWIFIHKDRINYYGIPGAGARFPSALIGVGVNTDILIELEGHILIRKEITL